MGMERDYTAASPFASGGRTGAALEWLLGWVWNAAVIAPTQGRTGSKDFASQLVSIVLPDVQYTISIQEEVLPLDAQKLSLNDVGFVE